MIPLRDNIRGDRTPYVTYALLVVNVAVFVWQWSAGTGPSPTVTQIDGQWLQLSGFEETVWRWGLRPAELTQGVTLEPATPVSSWATIVTSMFMHGGWLHLAGNMLFLWIFADNVEDGMGHGRFLLFYLIAGVAAAATQIVSDPTTTIPMVGASGAIGGVLGAYVVLYPRARVLTLIPIFVFIHIAHIPAFVFLGVWFLIQLLSAPLGGGTAWFAHIGGFAAGLVLAWFLADHARVREHRDQTRRRRGGPDRRGRR